jgi:hypothetical protein
MGSDLIQGFPLGGPDLFEMRGSEAGYFLKLAGQVRRAAVIECKSDFGKG